MGKIMGQITDYAIALLSYALHQVEWMQHDMVGGDNVRYIIPMLLSLLSSSCECHRKEDNRTEENREPNLCLD